MEGENTLGDRKMCTSSEGNAKIQPHTHGNAKYVGLVMERPNCKQGRRCSIQAKTRIAMKLVSDSFFPKKRRTVCWNGMLCQTASSQHASRRCLLLCVMRPSTHQEEAKNSFYAQLQSVLDKIPNRDMLILVGDMNAMVGAEKTDREREMGRHGLEEMNENGKMLADFCSTNIFVIGGTIFSHRKCDKATWVSSDKLTENQIDHVMMKQRYQSSLQDVRVRRGADIRSDHHLVVTKIKMRLSTRKNLPKQ